jgi:hypothetical protein
MAESLQANKDQDLSFGGRPPRLPLIRAASALASEVTFPPLRPSATAAGFLRCKTLASAGPCAVGIREDDATVFDCGGRASTVLGDDALGCGDELLFGGRCACVHALNIPNRLGYVKWAFC